MRVVADTDVVVAAMRSPGGASARLLEAVTEERLTLLCSLTLGLEYAAVCLEPEHWRAAGLTEEDARLFVDSLLGISEAVVLHYHWRPQLRDPGDEMVLETAINGKAEVLVTFNSRDYGNIPGRFGIELLLPRELLRRIRK